MTDNRSFEVYDLMDRTPTKEDANDEGKVLWFHVKLGWTEGDYRYPVYTDCTHWAPCPHRPLHLSPEDRIKDGFKSWLQSFPAEFPPAASALLELGFKGGAKFILERH